MNAQNKLIYVGDPMCSWCYGFAPQLEKIVEQYQGQMQLELVTGGLRPYNQTPISEMKDFLTGHWQEVNKRTQQPFSYDILSRADINYDTEPACRAVVVVRNMNAKKEFDFFKLTQEAFYNKNKNLSEVESYYPILDKLGLDKEDFTKRFNSEDYKKKVQQDFKRAGDLGVRGFPSVLLESKGGLTVLSRGYTTAEQIKALIAESLKTK
jgi:putative protein-disulfide isomerase